MQTTLSRSFGLDLDLDLDFLTRLAGWTVCHWLSVGMSSPKLGLKFMCGGIVSYWGRYLGGSMGMAMFVWVGML